MIRSSTANSYSNLFRNALQTVLNKLQSQDHIIIGLSGGSLINEFQAIFDDIDFDWSKVTFIFADERRVAFDDAESTFGSYQSKIINKFPQKIKSDQFLLIDANLDVVECAKDYERKLRVKCLDVSHDGLWPQLDLLLLGVGPDGHTCSLFPDHPGLKDEKNWVVAIKDSPKAPPERISLTLPVLNHSKHVVFVAKGASKAKIIKDIFEPSSRLPASLVKPIEGEVYWIMDNDAASLIQNQHFEN